MGVISGGSRCVRDVQYPQMVASGVVGWTAAGDSTLTLASLDRSGGGLSLATDNTDNDCGVAYRESGEVFDFGDVGCRCVMKAKVKFTQGASAGDLFIGFTDTLSSSTIADDEGGLASQDAIGFWVNHSTAYWRSVALNATADSGNSTAVAFATATTYDLRMEVEGLTGGLTIRYYVDNVLVSTVTGFTYTSFGPELQFGIAVANAGGGAVNTVEVYELDISHRANS